MILPSRYNLCKWKILDYNTCEICNTLETTKHMMLECENVRLFWRIVSGCNLQFMWSKYSDD